jgi:hypothetical protein
VPEKVTDEWILYEKGKDYNRRLNLYENNNLNERMYAGDQWNGVVSNGLPTPVFNIFKRVINYFISAILSQAVKMQFVPDNVPDDPENPIRQAADVLSRYSETLWEKLKMNAKMYDALKDAALSGDADGYTFWNPKIKTGQSVAGVEILGDIDFELIDNVNVFFGNPNDERVQTQPWIIVAFRELVSKLKQEAKKNGATKRDIELITSDQENNEQSGDLAKIELDYHGEDGKTIALIKFWRDEKTDTIKWRKSTKNVVIIKETDLGISHYPVAHMNWDKRKNSYHGQAVGTGLVPNQLFINKMFAMVIRHLMHAAFPKAVVNKNYIKEFSNQIGEVVYHTGAGPISDIAAYLKPGEMSSHIMMAIDAAINYTKELMGASDAALGDVKPENTSAIIALQQTSLVPLETIKQRLYQWVEDIGYIWLDFMVAKYGKRDITITVDGKRQVVPFDFSILKDVKFNIKIDVGPSSYWSEIAAMQTLDNLLQTEKISFIQYLERIPNGIIPKKQELITEIQQQMAQNDLLGKVKAWFVQTLPPEIMATLQQMKPEEADVEVEQLMEQMLLGGGGGMVA